MGSTVDGPQSTGRFVMHCLGETESAFGVLWKLTVEYPMARTVDRGLWTVDGIQ